MLDIGCVTCSYRIKEGSITALSGDLQYIVIATQCTVIDQYEVNLNINNAWSETKFYCINWAANADADCKLIWIMIKYKDFIQKCF